MSIGRSASCLGRCWLRNLIVHPTSWPALDTLHPQLAQVDDALRRCVRALVWAALDQRLQDRHGDFDMLRHLPQVLQELSVCYRRKTGL